MIPIAQPLIGEEEKTALWEVVSSGQLAQGPRVQEFEERFAAFCGARYAVATSSGTSALHIALLAHGIGPGDEVITSPFSFIASANCALFVGARPVFADIEPESFTLDPAEIEPRITSSTRAIIPVHLFGQMCDMEVIDRIASSHDLIVIEDACQAHGATFHNRPPGNGGTACYSFYPTKNMTTGEGGMITTDDPEIAHKARQLRHHGSDARYHHVCLGYNLRMTDMAAALGIVQLSRLAGWNEKRRENAAYLTAGLQEIPGVVLPKVRPGARHVFHQFTLRVQHRERLIEALQQGGIGFGIHYPIPIHQQPLYTQLGYRENHPQSEIASQEVISLPVHPGLTHQDLDRVIDAVAGCYDHC